MLELRRWSPFGELSALHKELDDFFKRTFETMGRFTPGVFREEWYPAVDAYMKDGKFILRAVLPGVDPKDVDISIIGNQLTIKGTRKAIEGVNDEDYILRELSYGSFERVITLPEGVLSDKVHATYRDGILEISMPCESSKVPRKVHIEVEEAKKKAA